MKRNKISITNWAALFEIPEGIKILEEQCNVNVHICIGNDTLTIDEYIAKVKSGEIIYFRENERKALLFVKNETK